MTMRIAVVVLALAIAGCARSEPEQNAAMEMNGIEAEPLNEMLPAPPPLPVENVAEAEPEPKPDPVADAAQIQDDADASGMTARMPAGEDSAPANEAAEAQ